MTAHIISLHPAHLVLSASLLGLSFPLSAWAHVGLDAPNGGESLTVGSMFQIEWNPTVPHDTINWDLFYSTSSSNGPWSTIALNLPLGNNTQGSPHFYDWTVPNIVDPTVWVRVVQDNTDEDYDDVSDGSFAILAALLGDYNASGGVDEGDFLEWRDTFGDAVAAGTAADGNGNGVVDAADYTVWRDIVEAGSGAASGLASQSTAVPEPASLTLVLAAGIAVVLFARNTAPTR